MNHKGQIEQVIDSFYDILSGKTDEKRNWDLFRALFIKGAHLFNYTNDNQPMDVDSYIIKLNSFLSKNNFYEYGLNYNIEIFGDMAHVYSEYKAKNVKEDIHVIKEGVNLIHLLDDGLSWKIVSMLWKDN